MKKEEATLKKHLLTGAVDLVRGRFRVNDSQARSSIAEELEPYFESENLLEGAPFKFIGLIFRYGERSTGPIFRRVNKRYNELEMAIELPMAELTSMTYDELRARHRKATLEVLIAVAKKYNLPSETWERLQED